MAKETTKKVGSAGSPNKVMSFLKENMGIIAALLVLIFRLQKIKSEIDNFEK